MAINTTRQGRFFGTQEALEADMIAYIQELVYGQEIGTYHARHQEYRHKDEANDHRIYWRLLNEDKDRRQEMGGMQFSHVTFHHSVSGPQEVMFVLSRLRFPTVIHRSPV